MKRDFSLFTGLLKTARNGDDLILTGVASSTIKDRHGDTMTPNALESMLRTADGMTIYLNHSYNVPEDVAGTVRSAWIDKSSDELHDLHFEIAMETGNPRAVQAFNAIDKGTKLGLSIGAMIPEGGAKRTKAGSYVINDVELLETSIVSIPANPRSWVEYARKSLMSKADIPEEEEAVEKELDAEDLDHKEDPSEEPVIEEIGEAPGDEAPIEGDGTGEALPPAVDLSDVVQTLDATENINYYDTTNADTTKSKVTVWPSGKVSVDTTPTTPSQDATPQAEPETEESTDALSEALGEMTRDITPEVESLLGPTVMASLQTSQQLVLALVLAVEKATERATRAESERDEVIESAKVLTKTTEAFIARVAATPRGRRAVSRELPEAAKALEGIRESGLYSDEFMDILQKGEPNA